MEVSYSMQARCGMAAIPINDPVRALLAAKAKKFPGGLNALSKAIGKNQTYLHQFVTKGSPRKLGEVERATLSRLLKVAEVDLGAPNDEIGQYEEQPGPHLSDTDAPIPPDLPSIVTVGRTEFARLPVHDIRAAAGDGAVVTHEAPIDWQLWNMNALRALTSSALEELSILRVSGDSMESELHDGDYIFVDQRKTRLGNPGIFVIDIDGDLIVKRASMHPETRAVTLRSDNPRYPEMVIKRPDSLRVIGRVFLVVKRK